MKQHAKRLIVLLLVAVLTLTLAACGQSGSGGSGDSGNAGANTNNDANANPNTDSAGDVDFPTKQVTIIMPWSIGGGPDVIARKIASYGDEYLGVPVIVENKNGGAGTIAMTSAVQTADDGYTMIVANGPLFSLTPGFQDVTYTLDDITPLIGMRSVEFVALTNPSVSGLETLDDIRDYAAQGNVIKYATTGGPGNDGYTVLAVLFERMGIAAEAVPYDGGLDAINALVGGHVDVSIGSPPVYADYLRSGELACLGTFMPESIEIDGYGTIPTFQSQGIDVEFIGMDYFAVRSSVDPAIQEILTDFIRQVYQNPEFQQFMAEMEMEIWNVETDVILKNIQEQTEAMVEYIELIQ